jgi:hypothetical protein
MARNRKLLRADEVFSRGALTVARFGKMVLIRNNRDKKQQERFLAWAAHSYKSVCEGIDAQVLAIRDIVTRFEPLNLLQRAFWHQLSLMMDKRSESDYRADEIACVTVVEYIQSIIVSATPSPSLEEHIPDDLWEDLVSKIVSLYTGLLTYYVCRSAYRQKTDPHYDEDLDAIRVQMEMFWPVVRGDRYTVHQLPYLTELLEPHDDIFHEIFGISVTGFVDGVLSIMNAHARGITLAIADMHDVHEQTIEAVERRSRSIEELSRDDLRQIMREEGILEKADSIQGRLAGLDLFDVSGLTHLPEALLSELSLSPGEDRGFLASGELSGWPLRLFPVRVKPFLRIADKYYCFDLGRILDDGYRMVERLVLRSRPAYRVPWKDAQTRISEDMPFRFFAKLLPGATVYRSVYYPQADHSGRTQWCETDGLLIFDDHLLIVEVKSGAFAKSPPTTDFPSYVDRVIGLVRKPALQAKRFIDYLHSTGSATIYDSSHNPIGIIEPSRFRQITACCVTLDPFTELAAKACKLKPMGVDVPLPVWCVSVDDLRVYSEILDSPMMFTHFLEERQRAASSTYLDLSDELDHLGLYIEHNRYVMRTENLVRDFASSNLSWNGFRQKLDYYYHDLLEDPSVAKKPRQRMPTILRSIIGILDGSRQEGRCKVASYLLDQDGESRNRLSVNIEKAIKLQGDCHRVRPFSIIGQSNITVFCQTREIPTVDLGWARRYALAQMLRSKDKARLLLILAIGADGGIEGVEHEFLDEDRILPGERPSIELLSEQTAKRRLASALELRGKIGRNDRCPCGSNLKYKNCCGRG